MNTDFLNDILRVAVDVSGVACVAGGYLRDNILNRPVKDVDIFVPRCGPVLVEHYKKHFTAPKAPTTNKSASLPYIAATQQISSVQSVKLPNGTTLEVIQQDDMLDVWSVLNRFDFGINRVAYTLDDGLLASGYFEHDSKNSTFTVRRCDDVAQATRLLTRYNKFTATKYRGWKLVVPEQFKRYFGEFTA